MFSQCPPLNCIVQCFSTAGTRPGTGTWRPFYRDLNFFETLKVAKLIMNMRLIIEHMIKKVSLVKENSSQTDS